MIEDMDERNGADEAAEVIDMNQFATVDMVEVDEAPNESEAPKEDTTEEMEAKNSVIEKGGDEEEEEELVEVVVTDEEDDFDDEDDDDDVKITIGDVKTNINFSTVNVGRSSGANKYVSGKLDIDSVALVNGTPVYEVDLSTLEEHPWREPGADLTDYFNYGFTEETWNVYCDRQRRLRAEYGPENAHRYYFNSVGSHYSSSAERSKPFVASSIPTVGAHVTPALAQVPNVQNVTLQPNSEQQESTSAQEPTSEPKVAKDGCAVASSEGSQKAPPEAMSATTEAMSGSHPSVMFGARGMPPAGAMHFPGFPPTGLPPMHGLPMAGIPPPPPGMLPPFAAPPPGIPFPPSFPYPMPHRTMFFPRGYAGFRNDYNEIPRCMDSYSDRSSDGRQSYERRRKREPYDSYRRSRSRDHSPYPHHEHRERSRRKRSHSRDRSRHRSRDDRGSRRSRTTRSSPDEHRSQRKSEKKEASTGGVKEKAEAKVEEKPESVVSQKSGKSEAEREHEEPKKSKEKESKSSSKTKHRESSRKERDSKERRREAKTASSNDDSKGSKKKRKHRDSH